MDEPSYRISPSADEAVERASVMDLRRLTEQVMKLHATLREWDQRLNSLEANLAGHERLLGDIGAYDAVESAVRTER